MKNLYILEIYEVYWYCCLTRANTRYTLSTPLSCFIIWPFELCLKSEFLFVFFVQGMAKEWNSLTALVTHHTVMRELLPCLLVMPRAMPVINGVERFERINSEC